MTDTAKDLGLAPSRDRLLDAIEARFATSGFSGTRLVDVAEDADLTTGAFYSYFPGKAAAFHVLFDAFVAELTDQLVAATDLVDFCERWIVCHGEHVGTQRAAEEVAHESPDFLAHLRRCRQLWAGWVMPHLPSELDSRVKRIAAHLTVDILSYYSFTASRNWTDHDPAQVAQHFSALLTSGLYLPSAKGVTPPRSSSIPKGPREPNPLGLMTWAPAEGRVVPSSKRGRTHRTAILDAATDVFGELGFNNISVGVIAERAGVSPATVYRYFRDKTDIFRCLLSAMKEDLYTSALIVLDDDGRMMFESAMRHYLEVRRQYAAVYRVWRELLEPGSEMQEAWIWIRRDFQNGIAKLIAFGARGGLISPSFDPDLTAELAVASFDGPSYARFDLGWDDGVSDLEFARVLGAIFGTGLLAER